MTTAAQAPTFPAEVVRWREEFESFRAGLPPQEPEWLRVLRTTGMRSFEELGFPTTRLEDWRHTSVAPIARTEFHRPPAAASVADLAVLDTIDFGHAFARRQLVFVNGRYAPDLSSGETSADGVHVRSLRETLDRDPQLVQPYLDRQASGPGRPFAALKHRWPRERHTPHARGRVRRRRASRDD